MKKIIVVFLFLALLGAGLFLVADHYLGWQSPAPVTLTLPKGSTLRRMSRELAASGVIADPTIFEALARLSRQEGLLKPGEYEFPAGMRASEVLEKIVAGKIKLYKLTIPEGFNLKDIETPLAALGFIDVAGWSQAVRDPAWLATQKVNAPTAEGYLFPDTYLVEKGVSGPELASRMIRTLRQKVTPEIEALLREKNLTLHQWVTFASLIEKETGEASERPLIASVFYNRLRTGMLLQTDPSVIYGIPQFNGNLTRDDLMRDTPYNTYTRPGLPPGPIASPGWEALMAVLHPAVSDYYYFVGKGDGTHYFSKTLEEHNQAVQFYQLHQGEPPSNSAL